MRLLRSIVAPAAREGVAPAPAVLRKSTMPIRCRVLVGVTVAPLSTWDKMAHQGVAKATFAAPVGGVAGLHLLSMHDLGPAIGEFTRLSGSTARVTIDWTAI